MTGTGGYQNRVLMVAGLRGTRGRQRQRFVSELFTELREFSAVLGGRIGGLSNESARNQKKAYDVQELHSPSIPESWRQRMIETRKVRRDARSPQRASDSVPQSLPLA